MKKLSFLGALVGAACVVAALVILIRPWPSMAPKKSRETTDAADDSREPEREETGEEPRRDGAWRLEWAAASPDATDDWPENVAITAVEHDGFVPGGSVAAIRVLVEARGYGGYRARVVLRDRERRELAAGELVLDSQPGPQSVVLKFAPRKPGRFHGLVEVGPLPDERATRDNRKAVTINVVDPRIKVLYIEGVLRAEGKWLMRALQSDPNVDLLYLVNVNNRTVSPRPRFLQRGHIKGIRLDAIPSDAKTWKRFDVIILGDVERKLFTDDQLLALKEAIYDGRGLLLLGGALSLGPGKYQGTPVDRFLSPVELGPPAIGQENAPFSWQLAADGEKHPIFTGIANFFPTKHRPAGPAMAKLAGCTRVGPARVAATVLAVHPAAKGPDGKPLTVVAVMAAGTGRSMVVTADTTHRWCLPYRGLGRDSPYIRFWGQSVRWLAGKDVALGARPGIIAYTDKGEYGPKDDVRMLAYVRDSRGQANRESSAEASIVLPTKLRKVIQLPRVPGKAGEHRATFSPGEPGQYTATFVARLGGRKLGETTVRFRVAGTDEMTKPYPDAADQKLLRQIARTTGGSYCTRLGLKGLAASLADRQRRKRQAATRRPTLLVLLDTSQSMGLPEPEGGTRLDRAKESLRDSGLLSRRREQLDVRLYQFGTAAAPLRADDLGRVAGEGKSTDIAASCRAVLERHPEAPLAGIVLLTDGIDTSGRPPGRQLRSLGVPVHAVHVGVPGHRRRPDTDPGPSVVRYEIAYTFPSYTGRKPRVVGSSNGDVRALAGTQVTVRVTTDKPVKSAAMQMSTGPRIPMAVLENGRHVAASFRIAGDCAYYVHLTDAAGRRNRRPRECRIAATPDLPPRIELKARARRDATVGLGEVLRLAIHAADDCGVSEVRLYARRPNEQRQRLIHAWRDFANERRVLLAFDWRPGSKVYGYAAGDEIEFHAVARDRCPFVAGRGQDGRSIARRRDARTPAYRIRLVDREAAARARRGLMANLAAGLRAVLEKQIEARKLVAALGKETSVKALQDEAAGLAMDQAHIFTRSEELADGIQPTDKQADDVKQAITLIAYAKMTQAVRQTKRIRSLDKLPDLRRGYDQLATTQDEIIRMLRRLVRIVPELAPAEDAGEAKDFPDEEREVLKDLLKALKAMVREKRRVTDELTKLPFEDYTPEDEKTLEQCRAIEEKWEQFLRSRIADLRKRQEQGLANTSLLDKLIELHSDVDMAKDALEAEALEIATAFEDSGLMLAEKLAKQIERRLPDTPDHERWPMGEPLTDGRETPMARLPKEVEELVGDLIEEEADLQQAIEDAIRAWADSMGAAGWSATDGPASTLARRRRMRRRLPNGGELSGRSGEGRQGQRVGERVEKRLGGKGGAAGRGRAGAPGEALEGPMPPDVEMKMKGFALEQAQIRNKAEKIALMFKVLDYPPVVESAIRDMKALEALLNSGRYSNQARRKFRVLLRGLQGARAYVQGEAAVEGDPTQLLRPHLGKEIPDGAGDNVR